MTQPDVGLRFVLDTLVDYHPALVGIDELDREFAGGQPDAHSRLIVEEALKELHVHRLVHRVGDFVFASRGAVVAHRIGRLT